MSQERRLWHERLNRSLLRIPFRDVAGHKGWFEKISFAQPCVSRNIKIEIQGWPLFERALRIAFMSDFHAGSHAGDLSRISKIIFEVTKYEPDLVLFGGDYVNMSLIGGGRLPPHVIAQQLGRLHGNIGRFAILGNHDYCYDTHAVTSALREYGITVLDHEQTAITFRNCRIDIMGLPDAHVVRKRAQALLAGLKPDQPTIVLTHDPVWFARVPAGPYLTLAGHTHGGQINLPLLGVLYNASKAPRRWSYGLIKENGKLMYVTAGLGTSGLPIRIGARPEVALLEVNGSRS